MDKVGSEWVRQSDDKAYRKVMDKIQGMIREGTLAPGDCLLSERELVDKLNVSRNSVREALKALETIGLVRIVPGQGAFVREPDSDDWSVLATILIVQNKNLKEIADVRRLIEIGAVELACQSRSEEDLQQMRGILQRLRDAQSLESRCEADVEFHVAVVQATHNTLLLRIMTVLSAVLEDQMPVILRETSPQQGLEEHWGIFEAIERRSVRDAMERIAQHIRDLDAIVDEELLSKNTVSVRSP